MANILSNFEGWGPTEVAYKKKKCIVRSCTLFGETFASPKTREFIWINFRDLTNRKNFER